MISVASFGLAKALRRTTGAGRKAMLTAAVLAGLALPQGVAAQDAQTLADIRQEMSVLFLSLIHI